MSDSNTAGRAAQPDSPEDLIAELARIMADGARDTPRQPAAQPAAMPAAPAAARPAPQPQPQPQFGQTPAPQVASPSAQPEVQPQRAASEPFRFSIDPEPAPKPVDDDTFRFALDPQPAPARAPEPAAPQPRIPGFPRAEAPSSGMAQPVRPAPAVEAHPADSAQIEPRPVPEWLRPKAPAAEAPARPAPAPSSASVDPFNFDFDLSREAPAQQRPAAPPAQRAEPAFAPRPMQQAAPQPQPQPHIQPMPANPAPAPAAAVDPIADLIARQLSEAMDAAPEPAPARAPSRPAGNPFPSEDDSFGFAPSTDAPEPMPTFEPDQRAAPEPERPAPGPQAEAAPMPRIVTPRLPQQAPNRQVAQPVQRPVSAQPASQPQPRPVRAAPDAGDPLSDIENLIGQAARAEIAHGRRAATPEPDPDTRSAEAAILRATTQAEEPDLERADRSPRERRRPVEREDERAPSGLGRFVLPAVVGTVLLVAAIGGYWFFAMNSGDQTVPVLSAGAEPVKEAAPAPEPQSSAGTAVFNQIEGTPDTGENEQLVPREQPAEDSAVSRVITPESTESGLANRKVRTVTVRPDGTIVSSDEGVAGTEVLPVERPDVPAIPGAAPPSDALASSGLLPGGGGETQAEESVAIVPVTPTPAGLVAPIPRPRLVNRASSPSGESAAVAPVSAPSSSPAAINLVDTSPAARAVATPVATATSSGAYVQMSSQRSEEAAIASQRNLQSRFGSIIGGTLEVQRADLGDKGVYYRVRLPVASVAEGNRVCGAVKSAGGDCFVRAE